MTSELHLGQLIRFSADPFQEGIEAAEHVTSGAILVVDGTIAEVGGADALRKQHPDTTVHDHGSGLILPGFVDGHADYPQTAMIASWGKRLIDWLNTYTFPEESRFKDRC